MEIECVRMGSVTYANKAVDILKNAGVRTKMKKIINEEDGCAYILEMDKTFFDKAITLLKDNKIKFERCEYR